MKCASRGFTLLELLLALALGALVLAGLLLLVQSTLQAVRAQQALGGLQAAARFAVAELTMATAPSGFRESPWDGVILQPLSGSADAVAAHSDRLVVHRRSRRNCMDNDNPVRDAQGAPAAWLLRSDYTVRDGWRLVETCHYGPGPGPGTRQLNAATLVEGVEAFQVLFAEDRDGDNAADAWVRAGAWSDERAVIGVRLALLVASEMPVRARDEGPLQLLDEVMRPAGDGRLRAVVTATVPLRGRLQ